MTTGNIVLITIGAIVGFVVMWLLGFRGIIPTWIFIFLGALAGGGIYKLVAGGESKATDKT